jgi:hypothetical protein
MSINHFVSARCGSVNEVAERSCQPRKGCEVGGSPRPQCRWHPDHGFCPTYVTERNDSDLEAGTCPALVETVPRRHRQAGRIIPTERANSKGCLVSVLVLIVLSLRAFATQARPHASDRLPDQVLRGRAPSKNKRSDRRIGSRLSALGSRLSALGSRFCTLILIRSNISNC